MSTRLTAREWDAVLTALSLLLAGETDAFEADEVEAAESALTKLLLRETKRQERQGRFATEQEKPR